MGLLDNIRGIADGTNTLGSFGIGLLSAPTGANFGQALGHGVQFASARQREAMQNEFLRDRLSKQIQDRKASAELQEHIGSLTGGDPRQLAFAQRLAAVDPAAATNLLTQPGGILGFGQKQELTSPLGKLFADLEAARAQGNTAAVRAIEAQIQAQQEPSGLDAKLRTVSDALGRDLTEKEVLGLAGGGTTINVGTGENEKVIPVTQLDSIRMPDGSVPPIGTTFGEAKESGARVFSAADLAKKEKLTSAIGIVGQLKDLAIGENGVFVGVPNNVIGRAAEGAVNIFGDLAGTKASIQRDTYTSLSQGTLAPLARSLGETGALATEDANRALKLLADIEGIPEGEDLARSKFAELEKIFRRGLKDFDSGGPQFRYNPATGQLEPL